MPKQIRLRTLSAEEEQEIRLVARARKEGVELVRRARLIEYVLDHPEVPASRAGMRVGFASNASGAQWVKRFNKEGVSGLRNRPKSGRPRRHSEAQRSQVIDMALQKPETLGYPFKLWTLARLRVALEERCDLKVARGTIWKWVKAEGLDWKRQQSWFHDVEQHDPKFVEKRGPSYGRM